MTPQNSQPSRTSSHELLAWQTYQELKPSTFHLDDRWVEHTLIPVEGGEPIIHHRAQDLTWDSERRTVAMLAGSQGGKTIFGPPWLWREIQRLGGGDYLAITSTYDLFKMKMLPSLLAFFEHTLGIGRYWSGDRTIELAEPSTGRFLATRSNDPMWARIILRSADSTGGLESGTAKAAWLDEAGQDKFDVAAWKSITRRLALARGRRLITTTLYEVGWVDSQIINRAVNGGSTTIEHIEGRGEIEVTDNPTTDITLVQFDSTINPEFPEEEYEEARELLPDDEFQAFYRGRRVTSALLVYDCMDPYLNTSPRFTIPDDWDRYLCIDPGGVNTAAVFIAEDPDSHSDPKKRKLYAYREYLAGGRTGEEHAKKLLDNEPGVPRAVGGSKSEDHFRIEYRAGGLPVRAPPTNSFDAGKQAVYALIKTRRLIIFDDLHQTLDQLKRYRYKRDRQGNVTDQIENKNAFHFMDDLRYFAVTFRPPGRHGRATVLRLT